MKFWRVFQLPHRTPWDDWNFGSVGIRELFEGLVRNIKKGGKHSV